MSKIIGNTTATPNPQPDWNQTDSTKADFIKNKPDISVMIDASVTSVREYAEDLADAVQENLDEYVELNDVELSVIKKIHSDDKAELQGAINKKSDATTVDALTKRVGDNETAISTLKGSGEGSVDKKINDAFNEFATNLSDDATVNTYKELIDYAATHGEEFTELVGEVDANAKAIDEHAKKTNPHGVTKELLGLENVENKSSATIRGELTSANVTIALGYTPLDADNAYEHPESHPAGMITGLAKVATSGNYGDLIDTPPLGSLAEKSEISKNELASALKTEIEGKAESFALENTNKAVSGNTDRIKTLEDNKDNYVAADASLKGELQGKIDAIDNHSHSNKSLLDTYDQTNANIKDAVTKKHSHSFTDSDVNDAISKEHTHDNKTALDGITPDDIEKWDAGYSHSQESHAPSDAQANVIESIKVNNKERAITNKSVDITIPTGSLADKNEVSKNELASSLKTEIENKAESYELVETNKNVSKNMDRIKDLEDCKDDYVGADSVLKSELQGKIDGINNHSHTNKDLLDSYNQTNVNIADAVSKKHSHSFVDTNVDDAISKRHSHDNKAVLDGIASDDIIAWNGAQANVIESIKVNNSAINITNKTVDITIPTGSLANKSEVSKNELSTSLKDEIDGKAGKETTLAGYGICDAYTKIETDGKITDAINTFTSAYITSDGGAIDKLQEIADWIDSDKNGAADIISDIEELRGYSHNHSNKDILDTYNQTNANIKDAVDKKHSHSFSDTNVDDAITKKHSHTNKSVLDNITSDNIDEWDAGYSHSLVNHAPSGAQANVIESVKVNNTALTVTNKTVNITVPTGSLAAKSEVSKDELSSALKSEIEGKADEATTLAGYGISDAYTKNETDGKITDAINTFTSAYITSDGGAIDKLQEIANWIDSDKNGAADVISDIETLRGYSHSHNNQDLLDTYDQTNTNIKDAVSKKHSHSFSDTDVADAITKKHSHTNKAILDNITSDNIDDWNEGYSHSQEAHAPSDAQANMIESIKVNNIAVAITNKSVNITVPTMDDVNNAIAAAITTALNTAV